MSDSSIFEKIANRDIPGYIIWESDTHIAFLTIEPVAEGHTLVVPKRNIGDEIFDLSPAEYQAVMAASYEVAHLLKSKYHIERVYMSVVGTEVPHVHVHLIPAHDERGLGALEPTPVDHDELARVHQKLTQ